MNRNVDDLSTQARRIKDALPPVRAHGRNPHQTRPLSIETEFTTHAEGSVLVASGDTKVICTASVEDRVPPFLRGSGRGWITAEYGMLPRSTTTRMQREVTAGKPGGRTQEIQRLIGRSLRSVVDLEPLGERTIWIDCDVIQADGGTRTAAITGGFVALVLALRRMGEQRPFRRPPLIGELAAVSVGIVDDQPLLDLDYAEDSRAQVDLNVVMNWAGELIEVQGTAEEQPFSRTQLEAMLDLAETGIRSHAQVQRAALGDRLL
ncbi:MAG: ribonuclease PH [SAR324 cluster bacterium]|nr:ribonuclease PH [SAR324 cluster bacterium]